MKENNFERELPAGYTQALYINAKDVKFGVIFNLIAVVVLGIVMAGAFLSLRFNGGMSFNFSELDLWRLTVAYTVFLVSMLGYIILHELVHGIAYKALTGERLTFGISWSCAFCGVPNIYTYRRAAIVAILAPFITFTVLLVPITVLLYFIDPLFYLIVAFLLGLHLGGCSGDLYVFYLLMAKFKDNKTLIRDTGPEQFFYISEAEN